MAQDLQLPETKPALLQVDQHLRHLYSLQHFLQPLQVLWVSVGIRNHVVHVRHADRPLHASQNHVHQPLEGIWR